MGKVLIGVHLLIISEVKYGDLNLGNSPVCVLRWFSDCAQGGQFKSYITYFLTSVIEPQSLDEQGVEVSFLV